MSYEYVSIHGICYDEGQSGNCGLECRGFLGGDCPIPEEIAENILIELGYKTQPPTNQKGTATMRQNHILSLLQTDYATVLVSYKLDSTQGDGALYTFKTRTFLMPGDLVVVPNIEQGFKIVRVVEYQEEPVIDLDAPYDYRWIVQRINIESYIAVVANEKEAIRKLCRVEAVTQRNKAIENLKVLLGEDFENIQKLVTSGT